MKFLRSIVWWTLSAATTTAEAWATGSRCRAVAGASAQKAWGVSSASGPRFMTALSSSAASSSPLELVKETVATHPVTVFSKTYCPYCSSTKALFQKMGIEAHVLELDTMGSQGDALQQALLEWTGQRTVPNVFIRGQHLGGNDKTQAAAASGKLQQMLQGE